MLFRSGHRRAVFQGSWAAAVRQTPTRRKAQRGCLGPWGREGTAEGLIELGKQQVGVGKATREGGAAVTGGRVGSWQGPCPGAGRRLGAQNRQPLCPFQGTGRRRQPDGGQQAVGMGGAGGQCCHTGRCRCGWRRWRGCRCPRRSVTPLACLSCGSRRGTAIFSTDVPRTHRAHPSAAQGWLLWTRA